MSILLKIQVLYLSKVKVAGDLTITRVYVKRKGGAALCLIKSEGGRASSQLYLPSRLPQHACSLQQVSCHVYGYSMACRTFTQFNGKNMYSPKQGKSHCHHSARRLPLFFFFPSDPRRHVQNGAKELSWYVANETTRRESKRPRDDINNKNQPPRVTKHPTPASISHH